MSQSLPPDPERRRVGSRYALGPSIGVGSQATTFVAVDELEGREVAVKEFRIRGASSWKDVELAEREAKVLKTLEHSRLPRYLDHFEENGCLYLVMELVLGDPVARLVSQGALDRDDVIRFLADASEILDYLHGRAPPIIHRDIKPSNVIRRPDGRYALVDFGAVRDHLRPDGGSTVVGTFGYMAPEQFQGRALPESDVYGVGATALTMLTGQSPDRLPHRGLRIDVRAALGQTADARLVSVLQRLVEPDPDRRPASLGEVVPTLRPGRVKPTTSRAVRSSARNDRPSHVEMPRRSDRPRRTRHRGRPPRGIGVFVLIAFQLGLIAARLGVMVGTQLIAPLVLTFLSLFIHRNLRNAAHTVRRAGHRADAALQRAQLGLHRVDPPSAEAEPPPRARRVAHARPTPTRVENVERLQDDASNGDIEQEPQSRAREGREV
jgi:serine/threonine protein kinase